MKLKASIGHNATSEIPSQRISLCDLSRSFRMKEIELNKGFVAIVDDEDYDYLMQWKWYVLNGKHTNYAQRVDDMGYFNKKQKHKSFLMHRLIMTPLKSMVIDHINHNGLDNRKENLRVVTHRENCLNRKKPCRFGYNGIYKNGKGFQARIRLDGKLINLGNYSTAIKANEVYMEALNNQLNKEKNDSFKN